ncbi:unnamed protein product [Hermetia illucens]|uniref:Chitin-binding type-2 domain-containing protein n=1 Tax=Hermetia illucens TaxID=343691 RepID=A0A7R8YPG1_HERIL|nr:uncharacterized protein LOC119648333 [Hermetia illucens]CAD7080691.1 unnamed protein product [Hermetia illucens]
MYTKAIQGVIFLLLATFLSCNGEDILGCGAMPHGSVLPHTDCYKFFYCFNGVTVILSCEEFYKFDQNTGKCVYSPDCSQGSSPPISSEHVCDAANAAGTNKPSGISCKYYYACVKGGVAVLQTCPDGWGFNEADSMCVKGHTCVKS